MALLVCAACASAPALARLAPTADGADLRPLFRELKLPIRPQGARGACSVFTVTGALEFALSKQRRGPVILSPEYLNWATNQVIGNRTEDRGQFFADLWRGFERHGICLEAEMPYAPRFYAEYLPSRRAERTAAAIRGQGPRMHWIKPNDGMTGITEGHLTAIQRVLRAGWPVCAGSYHSVLIVAYRQDPALPGGGTFVIRDSGSGLEGTMSFEEARARLCDVLWIEAAGAPAEEKGQP